MSVTRISTLTVSVLFLAQFANAYVNSATGLFLGRGSSLIDRNGISPQKNAPRVGLVSPLLLRSPRAADTKPATNEDMSPAKSVSESIFVEAGLDQCMDAVSDLDNYMPWCRQGGMKSVEILKRYDDGRAENVRFTAGKLGIDMVNVMEYRYDDAACVVSFNALSGDVMKTLDGCYRFEEHEGGTTVTYELLLGFGAKLPDFAIKAISGAIMRTALGALKRYVEEGSV